MTFSRKSLAAALLLTVTSTSFAFYQEFKMLVRNNSMLIDDLCFKTTDIFDSYHCGDYTSNRYTHGPKNWRLYNPNKGFKTTYDASCFDLFNSTQRTPKKNGVLDIRVTAEEIEHSIEIKDCHVQFREFTTH